MINYPKLLAYVVASLLIAAAFAVFYQPDRPPHPVVIVKPEPKPPVIEPPKPPEVVVPEPPKPPVVKPPVVKPKPPVKPRRPVNQSPGCRDVPRAAYNHPLDVVVAWARRMGFTEDRIVLLTRCWKGEHVN